MPLTVQKIQIKPTMSCHYQHIKWIKYEICGTTKFWEEREESKLNFAGGIVK